MADPGLWLAASLLLAVAGTNLAWLFAAGTLSRRAGRQAVLGWPGTGAVAWLLAALYMLLPPFAAWRQGVVAPYLLGLTGTDWLDALGSSGLLAVAIMLLALAGWMVYRRGLRLALAGGSVAFLSGAGLAPLPPGVHRWLRPLEGVLCQWHWAFYRAIVIAWLAGGAPLPAALAGRLPALAAGVGHLLKSWQDQPIYWGSWLGLILVAVEWALNPFTWRDLRTPGQLEYTMRTVGLAVATTALFALTRNFWLCLIASAVVEILIAGWLPLSEA